MTTRARKTSFSPRRWTAVLCLAAFAALPASAGRGAEALVTAKISRKPVTVGSQVDYSIIITTDDRRETRANFDITRNPQFTGLSVLSPNYSRNVKTSSINGVFKRIFQYTWVLRADRVGTAQITKGQIRYRGKLYDLPAFQVKIVKVESETLPRELLAEKILSAQTGNPDTTRKLKGRLFGRLLLSDTSPYLQETFVARYALYADTEGLARQISLAQPVLPAPAWDGFFAQNLKISDHTWRSATIGGRNYLSVTVARFLLTPQKSGEVKIPSNKIQCRLRVASSRSSFDDFFFSGFGSFNTTPVFLPVAAETVEVRALPTQGRPPSFQKAVGQFSFAARVDRTSMTEDDLLTVICEIGGQGFLGSVTRPRLPEHPDWEDIGVPQEKTQSYGNGAATRGGKKTFEFLLRPKREGRLTFPALAYAFFDPAQERYVEQVRGPFTIRVAKGKKRDLLMIEAQNAPRGPGRTPSFFGDKIAHIHTALPAAAVAAPLYRRSYFPTLQLAPVLLLSLACGLRLWRGYLDRNRDRLLVRSAGGRARRELRAAGSSLKKGDLEAFHLQLTEALRRYLGAKLERSAAGLTLEEMERACDERKVEPKTVSALLGILERCDRARYVAAASADAAEARRTFEEAELILGELDKALKRMKAKG